MVQVKPSLKILEKILKFLLRVGGWCWKEMTCQNEVCDGDCSASDEIHIETPK